LAYRDLACDAVVGSVANVRVQTDLERKVRSDVMLTDRDVPHVDHFVSVQTCVFLRVEIDSASGG
jgi:hypothetical protein